MIHSSATEPLDMARVKAVAEANPIQALAEFKGMVAHWREMGATVFLKAWTEAFLHYDGALPDEASHYVATVQLAFEMCGLPVINHIAAPQIRDVDANGVGPDGDEYTDEAAPELIDRGLALNVPVLLRYPDRRLEKGNEVRFTEIAVQMLDVDLEASVLPEDKWRQH
ncbi:MULTISPECIES: hypothetical protein [unclassified Bosea (in: a-proteobacteria)]|uniref:hypothetical protein n=1 Tax=unclassified Bosea (in: a-proteobacteria) TaxID=2653178 RepID=UPI000F7E818C|nr:MULTISPECIES: hypothetical protein [unclassified Bosea (in: a-proteobacteria)]